jgi:predicted AAA+ superfamily ATPase
MINTILSYFNLKLSRSFNGNKSIPTLNKSPKMLIELIGPPASGKTTLMKLINKEQKYLPLHKHFNTSRETYSLPTKFSADYENLLNEKLVEVSNRNIESFKKIKVLNS